MLPSMIDEININEVIKNETTDISNIGKSFLFDFDKGDFVTKDGKLLEVEGIEALKMWIQKVLRTEKFKFKVYAKEDKNEYGITIQDLIVGYDYSIEFVKSEIEREVTEALLKHPMISSLGNWNIEKNNPVLKVSFIVILKDGNTLEEEVNY